MYKSSSRPPVSIILPWWNTPIPLVERAIRSVLCQDYPGQIDLVLCNDGSDPNLVRQLEKRLHNLDWAEKRLRIFNHIQRMGISVSRNSAVEIASGEWLLWLDSDDTLSHDAVRKMVNFVLNQRIGLVLSSCTVHQGSHRSLRDPGYYVDLARKYRKSLFDPLAQVVFSMHAQLVRKDLFFKVGGFNPNYGWAELTEFFLRFVSRTTIDMIKTIPEPLYHYYGRRDSHSSDRSNLDLMRRKALLEYSYENSIPIQRLEFWGHHPKTHARHYIPIVRGKRVFSPCLDKGTQIAALSTEYSAPLPAPISI